MTSYIGAGFSSAGGTDAGYGAVDTAAIPSKDLLKDPFGNGSLEGRQIDPVKKDYVLGPNGTLMGMTRGQQAVELAFLTDLGSSAVAAVGNTFKDVKVISASFEIEMKAKIQQALSPAVNAGLIEIVSMEVKRLGDSKLYIITRWRDLTNGQEQARQIQVSG
jgi:hypothetical protein